MLYDNSDAKKENDFKVEKTNLAGNTLYLIDLPTTNSVLTAGMTLQFENGMIYRYDKNNALETTKLERFSVSQVNQSNVIEWKTSSEINTVFHVVERSVGDTKKFLPLETIDAEGKPNEITTYQYKDSKPAALATYRLKMVNHDGGCSYSESVVVKLKDLVAGEIIED
jgi:hypothetical protein